MPILDPFSLELFSRNPDQTRRFGMRFGALIEAGDVVCFHGGLGAGKTTLIQGIAQGWGSLDPVSSPTFVLINEYRRADGNLLFHMDAYRIGSVYEAEDLDLDRLWTGGALLVEWSERIEAVLPPDRLLIDMKTISEETRRITFVPSGEKYRKTVDLFRKRSFGV